MFDGTGDRLMLTWDLSAAGVTLNPGEVATLTFKVNTNNGPRNYCNQAWGDSGATSTGLTAKSTLGSPSGTKCVGGEVILTTTVDKPLVASATIPTFTYTTTLQNAGISNRTVSMVRIELPAGFNYDNWSAKYVIQPGGTVINTTNSAIDTTGGRQRLTWYPQPFNTSVMAPGETKTLTFTATPGSALVKGNYRTEAWAFFTEYDSTETPYTWPTALVQVLDPFDGTAWQRANRHLRGVVRRPFHVVQLDYPLRNYLKMLFPALTPTLSQR